MPQADPMTNSKLAKLFSFEFIVWASGCLIGAGIAYQAIASDIDTTKTTVHQVQDQQTYFAKDITAIKVSLAESSATQTAQAEDISEIKASLREGQKQILDILKRDYRAN